MGLTKDNEGAQGRWPATACGTRGSLTPENPKEYKARLARPVVLEEVDVRRANTKAGEYRNFQKCLEFSEFSVRSLGENVFSV